jgi:hypothetical protein
MGHQLTVRDSPDDENRPELSIRASRGHENRRRAIQHINASREHRAATRGVVHGDESLQWTATHACHDRRREDREGHAGAVLFQAEETALRDREQQLEGTGRVGEGDWKETP